MSEPVVWWWYLLISGWVGLAHVPPTSTSTRGPLASLFPATQIVSRWLELAHFWTQSHGVPTNLLPSPLSMAINPPTFLTHSAIVMAPIIVLIFIFCFSPTFCSSLPTRSAPAVAHTLIILICPHSLYLLCPSIPVITLITRHPCSFVVSAIRTFYCFPSSSPPLLTCDIRIHSLTYTIRIRTLSTLLIIATFLT